MRIAIIHYWLVNMRGGEKVLEALCELFPHADIYTHVYDPSKISHTINQHTIKTTFIQKFPMAKEWYQRYLPFMPRALESLDLSSYDLVISSESGPAKGVIIPSHIPHICYCHTPMRYLWDYYHHYLNASGSFSSAALWLMAPTLRSWDLQSANRVDHFIANSHNVARRIMRTYRRESQVIYPPLDLPEAHQITGKKQDFYLYLGQVTSYKRVDLAVEAFRQNGLPLIIAGGGDELKDLPANITYLGFVSHQKRQELLDHAKALIFPGEEDFGIVPLEAMAFGTPVIAYGKGGALETVIHEKTGLLFPLPTVDSLQEAISTFRQENTLFSMLELQEHAKQFSKERFKEEMLTYISRVTELPLNNE